MKHKGPELNCVRDLLEKIPGVFAISSHNFIRLSVITLAQIGQLSIACHEYFKVNALLSPSPVNPTVWTLGHFVPARCHQVLAKVWPGFGNGDNGRARCKAYLSEKKN